MLSTEQQNRHKPDATDVDATNVKSDQLIHPY